MTCVVDMVRYRSIEDRGICTIVFNGDSGCILYNKGSIFYKSSIIQIDGHDIINLITFIRTRFH